MTKKQRRFLIIGIVCAIVVGLYFLFADDVARRNAASSDQSRVVINDMDMREEKNGEIIWYLKADRVTLDANKQQAHLEQVEGYFKNGKDELKITAKNGLVDREKKTVHLEGEVKGRTNDGAVLTSPLLDYDSTKQILSSSKPFRLERDGKVLTADSFTADRILEEVKAKGHAKLAETGDDK